MTAFFLILMVIAFVVVRVWVSNRSETAIKQALVIFLITSILSALIFTGFLVRLFYRFNRGFKFSDGSGINMGLEAFVPPLVLAVLAALTISLILKFGKPEHKHYKTMVTMAGALALPALVVFIFSVIGLVKDIAKYGMVWI